MSVQWWQSHFTGTTKVKGKNTRRSGSSGVAEMVWTWHGAAERPRYEQRWSEKLDQRRLTAVYGGQAVTTSTLIVGELQSRGRRAGTVTRRSVLAANQKSLFSICDTDQLLYSLSVYNTNMICLISHKQNHKFFPTVLTVHQSVTQSFKPAWFTYSFHHINCLST